MSLWGTKPVRVNNFSTDEAATFNMDSSFQMIPVEEPKPIVIQKIPEPPVVLSKPQLTIDILQTIMPPGVLKRNAHLVNLILKK